MIGRNERPECVSRARLEAFVAACGRSCEGMHGGKMVPGRVFLFNLAETYADKTAMMHRFLILQGD